MRTITFLVILCFTSCSTIEHTINEKMLKAFAMDQKPSNIISYWDLPHQSDSATQFERRRQWKKVQTERYGHTIRKLPWVWNCYTSQYESWSWATLNREIQAGRACISPTGMGYDYIPPTAWSGWHTEAQDRKRFENKTDPSWWDRNYGRQPGYGGGMPHQ